LPYGPLRLGKNFSYFVLIALSVVRMIMIVIIIVIVILYSSNSNSNNLSCIAPVCVKDLSGAAYGAAIRGSLKCGPELVPKSRSGLTQIRENTLHLSHLKYPNQKPAETYACVCDLKRSLVTTSLDDDIVSQCVSVE